MKAALLVGVVLGACGGGDGRAPDASVADAPSDAGPVQFTLREVGRVTVPTPTDLVLVNTLLYVKCEGAEVMMVVDVSDPAHPRAMAPLSPAGVFGAYGGIAVAGNRAYLAHEEDGLIIADVSNPAAPSVLGAYRSTSPFFEARDVLVDGTLAFVADQDFGMVVFDVANPAMPVRRGELATDGPFGIARSGTTIYLADNDSGLAIIDVANPMLPVRSGGDTSYGEVRNVAVRDTTVFALMDDGTSANTGLVIVDAQNPAALVRLGRYATAKLIALHVADRHAYIAGEAAIDVVDIGDLSRPARMTSYSFTGEIPQSVFASATHVFAGTLASSGSSGSLVVLEKVPQ
jgi:hypothetical protein